MPSSDQPCRLATKAQLALGLRQGDVERRLALAGALAEELEGEGGLARAGPPLAQIQAFRIQPAAQDVVEPPVPVEIRGNSPSVVNVRPGRPRLVPASAMPAALARVRRWPGPAYNHERGILSVQGLDALASAPSRAAGRSGAKACGRAPRLRSRETHHHRTRTLRHRARRARHRGRCGWSGRRQSSLRHPPLPLLQPFGPQRTWRLRTARARSGRLWRGSMWSTYSRAPSCLPQPHSSQRRHLRGAPRSVPGPTRGCPGSRRRR
jgi:hypothetical protein